MRALILIAAAAFLYWRYFAPAAPSAPQSEVVAEFRESHRLYMKTHGADRAVEERFKAARLALQDYAEKLKSTGPGPELKRLRSDMREVLGEIRGADKWTYSGTAMGPMEMPGNSEAKISAEQALVTVKDVGR